MYLPQIHDERTTLCNYLDVQLDAIRASAYGLEDAQARQAPLRSELSISGILKHIVYCMKQSLSGAGHHEHDQPFEAFMTSFTPRDEEDHDALLATFDAIRAEYMTMCREGDLDDELPVCVHRTPNLAPSRIVRMHLLLISTEERIGVVRDRGGRQGRPWCCSAVPFHESETYRWRRHLTTEA